MSNIDHIILYLFLFFLMYVWGKEIYCKPAKWFWISAVIPILCYAVITGCRTWGPDYAWYKYKITHPNDIAVRKDEIIFQCLNSLIRSPGLEAEYGFILYGIIIMTGAFVFIRSFDDKSKYMFALIVPAILIETSTHIRQGIAFGVSLIALGFLNKKNWWLFALFSLIAFNIHKISALIFCACLVSYFLRNRIIPLQLSVATYCIAIILPEYVNYDLLQKIIGVLPIQGSKFQVYTDELSFWFSARANQADWLQSLPALILSALFDLSIMILSHRYLKIIGNRSVVIYYNLFVLGAILTRGFFLNELLRRTVYQLYMFYFVPLGYCLYLYNIVDVPFAQRRINAVTVCFGCTMLYLFLYWGRFIILNEDGLFIWSR